MTLAWGFIFCKCDPHFMQILSHIIIFVGWQKNGECFYELTSKSESFNMLLWLWFDLKLTTQKMIHKARNR